LLGVGRLVGKLGHDDHLRLAVNDRLPVEALVKGAIRGLHDLRLRVGEVPLRCWLRRERITPIARPPGLLALRAQLSAASPLTLGGLRLQSRLRLTDPGKPLLAAL
jgi:hypothetical protein